MAIANVIQYEGDNTTFIWKHPCTDFNIGSQLIVHESQEAIFFKNGEALDLFIAGRHTLKTQNIPLITNAYKKLILDGNTPFHCEVYFINKVEQMAIKWGTDSKVQYMDPQYNFPISIGASGDMSLRVENSRKLLLKLVGTEAELSQSKLTSYFRGILMTRVKSYIAQAMRESGISIFNVDEQLNRFSDDLKNRLVPDFANYGISLERFFVSTIVKPDGDSQYESFKTLHFRQVADVMEANLRQKVGLIDQQTSAQRMVIESQGIAQKRQIEGFSYQQERAFDIGEKVASNEGIGNFSNAGIGLGMMAGVGGGMGAAVANITANAMSPILGVPQATGDSFATQQSMPPMINLKEDAAIHDESEPVFYCDHCGAKLARGATFCDECGTAVQEGGPASACAKCGFVFNKPKSKFCPKCGTKRAGI